MRLYAISDSIHLRDMSPYEFRKDKIDENETFHVRHIAPNFQTRHIPGLSWDGFRAIDARPQYSEGPIRSIEDTNIFAPFKSKAEEVLVNKADMSVIEHLEAIKRLQDPEQSLIRKKMIESEVIPQRNVIVQLVEYKRAS
jgi:hypothetical protein